MKQKQIRTYCAILLCAICVIVIAWIIAFNMLTYSTCQQLIASINSNDQAAVERLLAQGANPNCSLRGINIPDDNTPLTYRLTPLGEASRLGHLSIVRTLLDYGAQANPKGNGLAPAYYAIRNGDASVAKALFESGADPFVQSPSGVSIFNEAFSPGRFACLVAMSPYLCTANESELALAIERASKLEGKYYYYFAQQLLCIWEDRESVELKMFFLSIINDTVKAQDMLKENPRLANQVSVAGWSALHWACAVGNAPVTQDLLKLRGDVNDPAEWGGTPLICAVFSGDTVTITFLLDHSADPNREDAFGTTARWAASYENRADIARLMQ